MRSVILILAIAVLASCRKDKDETVRYEVDCTSCDLTYTNSSENTEQRSMTNEWSYEFKAPKGQFVYISAQNNNASGTVGVKIIARGGVFESASSSGAYVIATASGNVP